MVRKLARWASIAAILASAIAASAIGALAVFDYPFGFTIEQLCVRPGEVETVDVPLPANSAVHIVVTYPDGTRLHNAVGTPGADGTFRYSWTIESNAPAGLAEVWLTVMMPHVDTAVADYHFKVGAAGQPCVPPPNEGPPHGQWLLPGAVTGSLRKVCAQSVSGSAVFQLSIVAPLARRASDAFTLPDSWNLTVACNGPAVALPTINAGITITLHEIQLPSGAAAASDTSVTMLEADVGGLPGPTVTVTNAKAAAVGTLTPVAVATTPPARRLAKTGAERQQVRMADTPALLWILVGLLAIAAAGTAAAVRRSLRRFP